MFESSPYLERRNKFLNRIGVDGVAVLFSSPCRIRNRDTEYPYRQDSDFHYLTGFDEPSSVAIFLPGRSQGEFVLFCREYDPEQAVWTGYHAGLQGAVSTHGADEAFSIHQLTNKLPELFENRKAIHYSIGLSPDFDRIIIDALAVVRKKSRRGIEYPDRLVDIEPSLHEMRLIKTSEEVSIMRQAATISVAAHKRAMRSTRPGIYEYEIEAEFLNELGKHGIRSPAYPTIVAGGVNACVLHYVNNADVLQAGDLLLIDAGAELEYYASDITRTYPVSGKFSQYQKIIYELVLDAQIAAIKQVKPGNRWIDPHDAAVRVLTKGLIKLGLLEGDLPRSLEEESYKAFYMHRTGHWLGMDVHDVGLYKKDGHWRIFEPGMVLTVEPGLYISPDCVSVDAVWRGIGVRIEDDVLVTHTGNEVLTEGLPKTVADLEAFLSGVS